MDDLDRIYEKAESIPKELEKMTEEFLLKLRVILWGEAAVSAAVKEKSKDTPAASPQQTKKRPKRLASLNEDDEVVPEENVPNNSAVAKKEDKKTRSPRRSKRSNDELLASADTIDSSDANTETQNPAVQIEVEIEKESAKERLSEATNLMPPPPLPIAVAAPLPTPPSSSQNETLSGRPQRAARIKSEKLLKEPSLTRKLRRPTSEDEIKIKLEHEQRASLRPQAAVVADKRTSKQPSPSDALPKESLSSLQSDDSVVVLPSKQPSIVSINSELDDAIVPAATEAAAIASSEIPQEKETTIEQNHQRKTSDLSDNNGMRELRIKIKREKVSMATPAEVQPHTASELPGKASGETVFKAPAPLAKNATLSMDDNSSLASSTILSSTTNTTASAPAKKGRKKKEAHRPIKVERFSDLDVKPVASRTRQGSIEQVEPASTTPKEEPKRAASIYEDAVETPPSRNSKENNAKASGGGIVNETVNIGKANDVTVNMGPLPGDATMNLGPVPADATMTLGPVPGDATFQVTPGQTTFVMDSNPNATVTLNNKHSGPGADATFDVNQLPKGTKDDDAAGQRSFETAKDSSMPHDDSLLTEDESCEQEQPPEVAKTKTSNASSKSSKSSVSTKNAYKMPTRTKELFNPLAQSPVKMRVEAFENAAAAATEQGKRPLRNKKENLTPSNTTPVIGKLQQPALGRFLTPTQGTNIATSNSAFAKKGASASKALPMPKSASASSLLRSNSTAAVKQLQRENSADDFRKGLNNLAEDRKKQREQKHLLAAQQREAKEKERAERIAKLAKEREEKRQLKKQQEQEQRKRELEEIQRKLRQQQEEDLAKQKALKERELLMQAKQQQLAKQRMLPPPPKTATKYTFEMLHEDDSTDDEDKVSYKRPPPPSWSRSHVRALNMLKQEYTPAACIDSFFSVQPMTPDLKVIFPNIDARHLKRNSSVLWSTPPRYSELPKY